MPAANPTPPIVHRLTWPDSYKIEDAAKGISRRAAIGIDNSQELLDQKLLDVNYLGRSATIILAGG